MLAGCSPNKEPHPDQREPSDVDDVSGPEKGVVVADPRSHDPTKLIALDGH